MRPAAQSTKTMGREAQLEPKPRRLIINLSRDYFYSLPVAFQCILARWCPMIFQYALQMIWRDLEREKRRREEKRWEENQRQSEAWSGLSWTELWAQEMIGNERQMNMQIIVIIMFMFMHNALSSSCPPAPPPCCLSLALPLCANCRKKETNFWLTKATFKCWHVCLNLAINKPEREREADMKREIERGRGRQSDRQLAIKQTKQSRS